MGKKNETDLRLITNNHGEVVLKSTVEDIMSELEQVLPPMPTGFECMDRMLDGGLYYGLYVIHGSSGTGKTSFCLQMANQIAKSGYDVIFVSPVEGIARLINRSISMISLEKSLLGTGDTSDAITTTTILRDWNVTNSDIFKSCVEDYAKYYDKICIKDSELSIQSIIDYAKDISDVSEFNVCLIIDDIQLLDLNYMTLNNLSNSYDMPIILTTDSELPDNVHDIASVIIEMYQANNNSNPNPIKTKFTLEKNRNGASGKESAMDFYPEYGYFKGYFV